MEYYENIKEAVTNLTNRIKLFSRVLTVVFMGLLLYSCANGDEIESDKTEEIAEYEDQIDEITDFIDEQTDLEVNTFQTNLLTWLNNKNNVQKATINNDKSLITVKFKNGYDFYINFQDMAIFDDEEEQNSVMCANISRAGKFFDYYDVSYQDDEEIIQSTNFLFAQTNRDMFVESNVIPDKNINNADEEMNKVRENIDKSPVKLNPDFTNDLKIMEKNWSDYGLIIITQTHGIEDSKGGFQIIDNSAHKSSNYDRIINVYLKNKRIIKDTQNHHLYWIKWETILSKLNYSNTIYLGSYCWSYELAKKHNGGKYTIIGNTHSANYNHNLKISNTITSNLFSGLTLYEAYNTRPYDILFYRNKLKINEESKKRYFSISTDEITNTNTNQPKISGKINGYENLKKDELTYLVYFHEGDADFSPKSAKDDECIILKTPEYPNLTNFSIEDNGKFSFTFPGWLKANTKYRIAFAFEYKDAIYYGERKSIVPEEKDNTLTNGELIDLGLSVKWASCNLGANAPSQLGIMYNIDFKYDAVKKHPELFNEDGTKANFCESDYDYAYKLSAGRMRMPSYAELKELKEKCTWELAVIDDVAGVRIVGPNKNSIFMPTVTMKLENDYMGASYILVNTLYASGNYDIHYGSGLISLCLSGCYSPQMAFGNVIDYSFSAISNAYIRPVGK